ncbi:MAG: alpha/beta fold hydrolase [Candidatus Binatia bacterium]
MKDQAVGQPKDYYFTNDGLTLHYAEWGDPASETLVLVHGNRDQCRSWDFFVSSLFAQGNVNLHVVALDLRGHGDSDWLPPGRGYRHEDFLLDLTSLFQHLKKDSIILAGHSLGGSMATLFAGLFPSKVRRLILVEATGPFSRRDEEAPRLLAQWLEGAASESERQSYPTLEDVAKAIQKGFPLIPDEAARHMARHCMKGTDSGYISKYDPRVRERSFSIFSEGQVRAFVGRIECPTLLVFGKQGEFINSPRASRVSLFKNRKVVEFEGTGHHVPHEKPEELAKIVYPFLR